MTGEGRGGMGRLGGRDGQGELQCVLTNGLMHYGPSHIRDCSGYGIALRWGLSWMRDCIIKPFGASTPTLHKVLEEVVLVFPWVVYEVVIV